MHIIVCSLQCVYICLYVLAVYFMSTVRKSAYYYCRAFISINGRRINYKYIRHTISCICIITIFRL